VNPSARPVSFLGLLLILATIGGCSPGIQSTVFESYPPKPDDHQVTVFSSSLPKCPYDEIGMVSARRKSNLVSMQGVLESIRRRVREMGGDAIIGFGETTQMRSAVATHGEIVLDRDPVLSGTVIHFRDPKCTD